MAAQYDIEGRQGNSLSLTFRFMSDATTVIDLTDSAFVLRASHAGGTLVKSTEDATLTLAGALGEVMLALTAEETRALPAGALTTYELEQRYSGEELTLVEGRIIMAEGVNSDG